MFNSQNFSIPTDNDTESKKVIATVVQLEEAPSHFSPQLHHTLNGRRPITSPHITGFSYCRERWKTYFRSRKFM